MRLYKMELYKICHKRFFVAGTVVMTGILLFFFWLTYTNERATVDGVTYTGYQAIQKNRQITEEFKGNLTEEKLEQMREKYLLEKSLYDSSQNMDEEWKYYRNINFLDRFVMNYLSFGYSMNDTDLGAVRELTGKEIILEYYNGWQTFFNTLELGMFLGSILILIGSSTIFAGEGQTKMLPLLFTTPEGKKSDIHVKIAAAFTVAVGIWLAVVILDLLLCGAVYGFDGLNCYNGMVLTYLWPRPECLIPMYYFVPMAVLLSFLGIVSLCAITLCISAYYKSTFHAVVVAAVCWGTPILVGSILDGLPGIFRYLYAAPAMMIVYATIFKTYDFLHVLPGISIVVSILCTIFAYRKYRGQQAN